VIGHLAGAISSVMAESKFLAFIHYSFKLRHAMNQLLATSLVWVALTAKIALADDAASGHPVEASHAVSATHAAAVPLSVKARSPLGIGFLWTSQSDLVVSRLDGKQDFVDVILGPGKLDVFRQVKPPARVACIARSLEKDPTMDSTPHFPALRSGSMVLSVASRRKQITSSQKPLEAEEKRMSGARKHERMRVNHANHGPAICSTRPNSPVYLYRFSLLAPWVFPHLRSNLSLPPRRRMG
jgi:hypothetical protein